LQRGTRIAAAGDFSSAAREVRQAINHLLGERIKIDKRAIFTSSETKLCALLCGALINKSIRAGARAIYLAYLSANAFAKGKQASTFSSQHFLHSHFSFASARCGPKCTSVELAEKK
jgi:hypothetical protein